MALATAAFGAMALGVTLAIRPEPMPAEPPAVLRAPAADRQGHALPTTAALAPARVGEPAQAGAASTVAGTVAPLPDAQHAVDALVAELCRIERDSPDRYHELAAATITAFVGSTHGEGDLAAGLLLHRLLEAIDGPSPGERVRGALLATAGGLGAVDEVARRMTAGGEELRSALIGLGWEPSSTAAAAGPEGGERGLVLDPIAYFGTTRRAGHPLLPLPLSRIPARQHQASLGASLFTPPASLDEVMERDLRVLLLGTGADTRPDTLRLFDQILHDLRPFMLHLRNPICFVLAQARSDEAHAVLLAFLDDPQTGDFGKALARWRLSAGEPGPGDVDAIAAPLLDPDSSTHDRIMAAGSLMRMLERAGPDELAFIEEVLARQAVSDTADTSRLAAITTLAHAPGGVQRLLALERALRTDGRDVNRRWAAVGLGRTPEPFAAQARAMLSAALPLQTDADVIAAIQEALSS